MAQNVLVKVASDVFVNFYEVASVESDGDDGVLIVLKNGHTITIADTTAEEVQARIARHINGDNGHRVWRRDEIGSGN